MIWAFLVLSVLAFHASSAQAGACTPSSRGPTSIHWSEEKALFSPSCRWSLRIRPTANDGPARVEVRASTETAPTQTFRVERDAVAHWSSGDTALVVEDMQLSNRYRVMLFDPISIRHSMQQALRLNALIRSEVRRQLRVDDNIAYYFPRFVDWTDGGLVVSVGVVTVKGETGPFDLHCYAYDVSAKPLKIKAEIGEARLKEQFGAACQLWP